MKKLLVATIVANGTLLALLVAGVLAALSIATGATTNGPSLSVMAPASAGSHQLLSNPRLSLSENARADLAAGVVDPRLVTVLGTLLTRHTLHVGVFKSGHSVMIVTDTGPGERVSTHFFGKGVDIMSVDGVNVSRTNRSARSVVVALQVLLRGTRSEIGQPWGDLVGRGTFTNRVHQDHIHVGLF